MARTCCSVALSSGVVIAGATNCPRAGERYRKCCSGVVPAGPPPAGAGSSGSCRRPPPRAAAAAATACQAF